MNVPDIHGVYNGSVSGSVALTVDGMRTQSLVESLHLWSLFYFVIFFSR